MYSTGAGTIAFTTAGTQRLVIDSTGNVGIGTTGPNYKFVVAGTISSTSGGYRFPDGTTQTTASVIVPYDAPASWGLTLGANISSSITGNYTTAVGNMAAVNLTSGASNTMIGAVTGYGVTTGTQNTFVGATSGYNAGTLTSQVTAVGYNSARDVTGAVGYSTYLGTAAGNGGFGTNGIAIGYNSKTAGNYGIAIGVGVTAGTNTTVIGTSGQTSTTVLHGNVGVGMTSPYGPFQAMRSGETSVDPSANTGWLDFYSVGATSAVNGRVWTSFNVQGSSGSNLVLWTNNTINGLKFSSARRSTTDENTATYAMIESDAYSTASNTGGYIRFQTRATGGGLADRMQITETGVGIGMTPSYQLQLSSDSAAKPGTSTWTIASDVRLKDVRAPFTRGLDALEGIETIYFSYKKDNPLNLPSDKEYVGIRAQDARSYVPEAVGVDKDGFLHVTNDAIIWTMLNAIKELFHKWTDDSAAIHGELSRVQAQLEIAKVEAETTKLRAEVLAKENIELKARVDRIEQIVRRRR